MAEKEKTKTTKQEQSETIREEDGTVQGEPEEIRPDSGTDSTGPGVGRGPEPEKDQ